MTVVKSTITSLIQKIYKGSLANTLQESSPAYNRLEEKGKVVQEDAIELRWPTVEEANQGATNINDGETLPDSDQTDYGDALLDWKIVISMLRFGRVIQRGAEVSEEYFRTAEGGKLLDREMKKAIRQLARRIHTQIVARTAADAKNITSMGDAVGLNNNTYAGIDRATYTYWQPYVNAGGGGNRDVSEALLRDVYDTLTDDREAQTTELWAGVTAWNAMVDLYTGRSRFEGTEEIRGGTRVLYWNGLPVVRMPNMYANDVWFLDFDSDEGIELKKQHSEDFLVREEDTNSYDDRWSVAGHYELLVHNPFKQGALKNVQ